MKGTGAGCRRVGALPLLRRAERGRIRPGIRPGAPGEPISEAFVVVRVIGREAPDREVDAERAGTIALSRPRSRSGRSRIRSGPVTGMLIGRFTPRDDEGEAGGLVAARGSHVEERGACRAGSPGPRRSWRGPSRRRPARSDGHAARAKSTSVHWRIACGLPKTPSRHVDPTSSAASGAPGLSRSRLAPGRGDLPPAWSSVSTSNELIGSLAWARRGKRREAATAISRGPDRQRPSQYPLSRSSPPRLGLRAQPCRAPAYGATVTMDLAVLVLLLRRVPGLRQLPPVPTKEPTAGGGANRVPGPWHSSEAWQGNRRGIYGKPPSSRAT